MWVTTQIQKMDLTDKDKTAMFDKLFHYISGNNTERKIFMSWFSINTYVAPNTLLFLKDSR